MGLHVLVGLQEVLDGALQVHELVQTLRVDLFVQPVVLGQHERPHALLDLLVEVLVDLLGVELVDHHQQLFLRVLLDDCLPEGRLLRRVCRLLLLFAVRDRHQSELDELAPRLP